MWSADHTVSERAGYFLAADSGNVDVKTHPDFRRSYNAFCLKCLAAAASAGVIYVSSFVVGGQVYDLTAMGIFFSTILSVLALCVLRLYRVRCPDCHSRTRVFRDTKAMKWVGVCAACQVQWQLGVDAF
jgi:hypothetical protein